MTRPFLHERVSLDARYGTSFTESFSVSHVETVNGDSYSQLLSPYPKLRYELNFANCLIDEIAKELRDLYMRSGGTFGGFLVRHFADFSTNDYTGAPTHTDQILLPSGTNKFQLVRWYGTQNDLKTPRRIIRKPVSSTVKIGVAGGLVTTGFSVDYATGVVTFSAPPEGLVTGGCEYDIPMRFESEYSGDFNTAHVISANLNVVELMNP